MKTTKQVGKLLKFGLRGTMLTLVAAGAVQAASFPAQPVTLVVPFPPGGTTDIAARTVAQAMEKTLGKSVVVDNRAGAGGNIGMAAVARAKADGYTIGMGTIGTQSINQFLYKDMAFDPDTDFEPIALVMTTPNVIAVNAQSDIKTMKDLVEAAKAGKLSYASPGVGSSVHLTGAYLEQELGVEMLHVPFKGVANSMPALIGGQVDVLLDNLPSTLAQIQDGSKVRGVAVTSAQRSPSVPDVPTVAESAIPNFGVTAWFALYAPKGTPQEALDKLTEAASQALSSEEVKERFKTLGAEVGNLTGDDLRNFEKEERARWSALVQERSISTR